LAFNIFPAWFEGEGLVLGGSTEEKVEQYLLSQCFTVNINGVVWKFVPMVVVVDREDVQVCNIFLKY
jgi:hypothetical protein